MCQFLKMNSFIMSQLLLIKEGEIKNEREKKEARKGGKERGERKREGKEEDRRKERKN